MDTLYFLRQSNLLETKRSIAWRRIGSSHNFFKDPDRPYEVVYENLNEGVVVVAKGGTYQETEIVALDLIQDWERLREKRKAE